MTNAALIAKLEIAQEGSRELSDEVLTALEMTGKGALRRKDWDVLGKSHIYVGRYDPTGNLQDAVDLVPGNAHWSVSYPVGEAELIYGGPNGFVVTAYAATGALALCIAVLRTMEVPGWVATPPS